MIECLTNRRFSLSHLAQFKFILPEAIELNRHDGRTCLNKLDIRVKLNVGAIKHDRKQKNATGKPILESVFRERLLNFVKDHPEEEVPEGSLPEPLHKSQINLNIDSKLGLRSTFLKKAATETIVPQPATSASHISPTFPPRFSKQLSSEAIGESIRSPIKLKDISCVGDSPASVLIPRLPETPTVGIDKKVCALEKTSTMEGTLAKDTFTPGKLMSATSALASRKRCDMTHNNKSTTTPDKRFRGPLCCRSLRFDTSDKIKEVEDRGKSSHIDLSYAYDILPECLLQSIREKELKNQAERRKLMISKLPSFLNMIRYSFQSNHFTMTKEELFHKLLTTPHITDREEIEEQLALLIELAPEFIHEKLLASGVLIIGINEMIGLESIQSKLVKAKSDD